MRIAIRDSEREWLPAAFPVEAMIEDLSAADLRRAAETPAWRCDHFFVHLSDLDTDDVPPSSSSVLEAEPESPRRLSLDEAIRFFEEFFLPNKIAKRVWIYSGGNLQYETREKVVVVGYPVPYEDPPERFSNLTANLEIRQAKPPTEGGVELLEPFAALDILCQGFLAVASAPAESPFREENPVYQALSSSEAGVDLLDAALRDERQREIWMDDHQTGLRLEWFKPGLEEENWTRREDLDPRTSEFWGELGRNLASAESQEKWGGAKPETSLELRGEPDEVSAVARSLWGDDRREVTKRGMEALARLLGAFSEVGLVETEFPNEFVVDPVTRSDPHAWFRGIRDFHVGYVVLSKELVES